MNSSLFLGVASRLDAFSGYPQWLSCPAMPYQTTGTPEATPRCSSRTRQSFPAVNFRFHQVEADLSHDGWFRRFLIFRQRGIFQKFVIFNRETKGPFLLSSF